MVLIDSPLEKELEAKPSPLSWQQKMLILVPTIIISLFLSPVILFCSSMFSITSAGRDVFLISYALSKPLAIIICILSTYGVYKCFEYLVKKPDIPKDVENNDSFLQQFGKARIAFIVAIVGADAFLWGNYSLFGLKVLINNYMRDNTHAGAILIFGIIPALMLTSSLIAPMWYAGKRSKNKALLAPLLTLGLYLPYIVFMFIAMGGF